MSKPTLFDGFCHSGGACKGYQRAGFYVVGCDIEPRPDYCGDEFIQADALELLADRDFMARFDAAHTSPPCQGYTQFSNLNAERWGNRVEHPMLIEPVRELLIATGLPYVIENVPGAPLRRDLTLCGSMFGLGVRRHRIFEANVFFMGAPRCDHTGDEIAVYGKLDGRRVWTRVDGSEVRCARTIEQASEAMGIDWMDWDAIKEAIPPAYTQWIGERLLEHLALAA